MVSVHCLGVGLVGSYVARRLNELGYSVYAYDIDFSRIKDNNNIKMIKLSKNENPAKMLLGKMNEKGNLSGSSENEIVVNMLPGNIGHESTEILSKFPLRIVDLSFSELTPDRNKNNVMNSGATILWDIGIAPGLSNMLLSEAVRKMGKLKNGTIKVGGNPSIKTGGWNYMAPFSPVDVIAEYTRPARVIRNSKAVILPALSDRHIVDVPNKGEMEAFLTDGLRSVINSIRAENLYEYTIRWPGHIQKFIDTRNDGDIDEELLTNAWKYDDKVSEFTWMEVEAESQKGQKMNWTVYDEGGKDGHSMARCTGLVTLGSIVEWINDENMLPSGIFAPEDLSTKVISRIIKSMKNSGIQIVGPEI